MKTKTYSQSDFYTIDEVCDILRVSRMTIYRYIKAKKLLAYKLGKEMRIAKTDFQLFLDARKTIK